MTLALCSELRATIGQFLDLVCNKVSIAGAQMESFTIAVSSFFLNFLYMWLDFLTFDVLIVLTSKQQTSIRYHKFLSSAVTIDFTPVLRECKSIVNLKP